MPTPAAHAPAEGHPGFCRGSPGDDLLSAEWPKSERSLEALRSVCRGVQQAGHGAGDVFHLLHAVTHCLGDTEQATPFHILLSTKSNEQSAVRKRVLCGADFSLVGS